MQPVAFTFDDRGRLWVAENITYPLRAPEGEGHDKIIVFEDTAATAISTSAPSSRTTSTSSPACKLVSAVSGSPPRLTCYSSHSRIATRRNRPVHRKSCSTAGVIRTHTTRSARFSGGRTAGSTAATASRRIPSRRARHSRKDRLSFDGSIWRYHPTKHAFEIFAEGLTNPWGIDYNDRGQIFATGCVIPHLWHIIQGARYQRPFGQHAFPYTYDDVKTIADHNHWSGEKSTLAAKAIVIRRATCAVSPMTCPSAAATRTPRLA